MKIAILSGHDSPVKRNITPVTDLIFYLIKELIAQNHEVDLYALSGSSVECNLIPLNLVVEKKEQISMYTCGSVEERTQSINYAYIFTKIAKRNYDLVHNFSTHYMPLILGDRLEIPFVVSFSEYLNQQIELGLSLLKHYRKPVFTFSAHSLLEQYYFWVENTRIISNGIEVENVDYLYTSQKSVVGWDGDICFKSGTHLAIEACRISGYKALVMGAIKDQDYFEEMVKPAIKEGVIRYVGDINPDMKRDIIGNCNAVICTAGDEDIKDFSIMKTLSYGTPVIGWDLGIIKEIITPETGFLVPVGDIRALAEAIEKTPSLSRENCRKRALDFDIKHKVKEYISLYEELLTDKKISQ